MDRRPRTGHCSALLKCCTTYRTKRDHLDQLGWTLAGSCCGERSWTRAGVSVEAKPGGRESPLRNILGLLDDAALLLLVVLLFPLVILLVGMPVALCVQLLVEIARRLSGVP